jgi:hypothetical protein
MGARFETKRTDVLSGVLNLREHSWDLGEVEGFRVEHGVVGAVIHGIEGDLKFDNLVRGRQLRLND